MINHKDIDDQSLRKKIRNGVIGFGGNKKLKIYGTLSCVSGKKLNRSNRVFFHSIAEAVSLGFHPCGHCLREEYKKWKNETF